MQGLADAEVWDTGPESDLTRNSGEAAGLGRLRLWAIGALAERFQAFAMGSVQRGRATGGDATDLDLEQAYLRYSFAAPRRLILQAGKMTLPAGNFARRYLSSRNPLIGAPANYGIPYPVGIEVAGSVGRFDGLAAILDRPVTTEEVLLGENPSRAFRPLLAAGVTPIVGLRLGAYTTRGPYLTREWQSMLPAGDRWRSFQQRVTGMDLQFSRAHFELNGDFALSRYEVPRNADGEGKNYYLEPKYTWSPRWFTALRLERSHLPYIWPVDGAPWYASVKKVYDGEVGVGFRVGPELLLKASYRYASERTRYKAYYNAEEGHALAFQVSYSFDVNSWIERPR